MVEEQDDFTSSTKTQARKAKVKQLSKADDDALRTTMSTKEGRRTIWRVLKASRFYLISFTGGSETFFREGMRAVGKMLHDELERVCPDLYTLMMSENRPKEATHAG